MVKEEDDEGENTAAATSNSKKVTLSNGKSFYARYKRMSRWNLPRSVITTENRKVRPRQWGTRKT